MKHIKILSEVKIVCAEETAKWAENGRMFAQNLISLLNNAFENYVPCLTPL